jgi:putative alpha-1,2-mannosidase
MTGKPMLRTLTFLLLLSGCVSLHGRSADPGTDCAALVNPFIGASTSVDAAGVYHGLRKTFPGAATPFGMVQVSPNTITGGDNGPGYSYEHKTIEGFAVTQMSGIGWYGDLGNFLVMPTTGALKTSAGTEADPNAGYRSRYSKATETAAAGYYSVVLDDYKIKAETTATTHCGFYRFTFPKGETSRIQIDLARRVGGTSTLQRVQKIDEHTIAGWMQCPPEGGGWGNGDGKADYTVYFYAQFSKPLKDIGTWSAAIPDGWSRKREDVTSTRYQDVVARAEVEKGLDEKEGKHLASSRTSPPRKTSRSCSKPGSPSSAWRGRDAIWRRRSPTGISTPCGRRRTTRGTAPWARSRSRGEPTISERSFTPRSTTP